MNGKINLEINGKNVQLWFNNYSKAELAKIILPEDKGFPAKPEEFPLINAIQRLSETNYLSLLRDLIWSGILGQSFATDTISDIRKKDVAEFVAVEDEKSLYKVWLCYLDAMGVNIANLKDKLPNDDSKKKTNT